MDMYVFIKCSRLANDNIDSFLTLQAWLRHQLNEAALCLVALLKYVRHRCFAHNLTWLVLGVT